MSVVIPNPLQRLRDSWTIGFMRRWTPVMGLRSAWTYRDVGLRAYAGDLHDETVRLRMRRPFRGDIVLRENVSDLMTFTEIFEWDVYRPVTELRHNVRTIVDLGANIGLASLCFAARWPESRVIALEPNSSTFRVLQRNLATLRARDRCEVLQAAIWSRDTTLVADSSIPSAKFNWFRVGENVDRSAPAEEFQGISMAALMRRYAIATIDLLKVDIEGAETELFRGNVDWLAHTRAIAIEFHQTHEGNTRQLCGFDALMQRYGLCVVAETRHTIVAARPT